MKGIVNITVGAKPFISVYWKFSGDVSRMHLDLLSTTT